MALNSIISNNLYQLSFIRLYQRLSNAVYLTVVPLTNIMNMTVNVARSVSVSCAVGRCYNWLWVLRSVDGDVGVYRGGAWLLWTRASTTITRRVESHQRTTCQRRQSPWRGHHQQWYQVTYPLTRPTQPFILLESINPVPALIGWGKGGNVTSASAGWQVTQ